MALLLMALRCEDHELPQRLISIYFAFFVISSIFSAVSVSITQLCVVRVDFNERFVADLRGKIQWVGLDWR